MCVGRFDVLATKVCQIRLGAKLEVCRGSAQYTSSPLRTVNKEMHEFPDLITPFSEPHFNLPKQTRKYFLTFYHKSPVNKGDLVNTGLWQII